MFNFLKLNCEQGKARIKYLFITTIIFLTFQKGTKKSNVEKKIFLFIRKKCKVTKGKSSFFTPNC